MSYTDFFCTATGLNEPYPYQTALAEAENWPQALNVPTGMGKTAAVTLAWAYKRGWRQNSRNTPETNSTPRRLIWCLPMRVLVEQTESNLIGWLNNLGIFAKSPDQPGVSVHKLMGGESDLKSWAEHPEQDMILIGTQDMLLSRALMRGYGMSRYQWPVHFAMLHTDCLWAFDEVQLMGPALATSAQLEAFRREFQNDQKSNQNSHSLWLSATLNTDWLSTVDFQPHIKDLKTNTQKINDLDRKAARHRLKAIKFLNPAKTSLSSGSISTKVTSSYLQKLCEEILEAHDPGCQTLVILNQVGRAQELFGLLQKQHNNILLIHSRFRPAERKGIEQRLSDTSAETGRIIITTQAIEAGVDISSKVLFTELAPWTSLVQRFGRCNRRGEHTQGAHIYWIDIVGKDHALPYENDSLDHAREQLKTLTSASPDTLPSANQAQAITSVIRRKDFLDLFNTDPDLSGFDVDISEYIRDTERPGLQVFWRDTDDPNDLQPASPSGQTAPHQDELCPVSIGQATQALKKRNAWIWDPLIGRWSPLNRPPQPGMTLLLSATAGAYTNDSGFLPNSRSPVPVNHELALKTTLGDEIHSDPRSFGNQRAVPLEAHLEHVAHHAEILSETLLSQPQLKKAVVRATQWHDVGKAHRAFQTMLLLNDTNPADKEGQLWAKNARNQDTPRQRAQYAVCGGKRGYTDRPGFRHELASTLAWLAQHDAPDEDITGLKQTDVDLIAYLIAAHHGKVRMSLRALPTERASPGTRHFARGVWHGDTLPALNFGNQHSAAVELNLDLMQMGDDQQNRSPNVQSWSSRTLALLDEHGPFQLAWAETLVRIADWRASAQEQTNPLEDTSSKADNARHELETKHSTLASTQPSATTSDTTAQPAAQGSAEHGLRGRTGGPDNAGTGTQAPAGATRQVNTALGTLSYTELAPHLAQRVEATGRAISEGIFAKHELDESLIRELHQRICADLIPDIAGRWRNTEVQVGTHTPPPPHQLPVLMRDYTRDLQTRIDNLPVEPGQSWLETLAFAESRLLSIHPFHDFNGRTTRLFIDLLLHRLKLPDIDIVPTFGAATQRYLDALRAADQHNLQPLITLWQQRLEQHQDLTPPQQDLPLKGCSPTPIASYLKALGIIKILGEQQAAHLNGKIPGGYWQNEHFHIRNTFDKTELCDFFLNDYRPSPILSPWNGGSGFFAKDNADAITRIESTENQRFQHYGTLITQTRRLLTKLQMTASPKDEQKSQLIRALRSHWPDDALAWLDAAIVLTDQRRDAFPLLGKGGIEGRLDFSNNYMQQLVQLWDTQTGEPSPNAAALLNNALFASPVAGLLTGSPGQLNPFATGGPNAGNGYEVDARATGLINPWDYLFMLEGATLLASRTTRRLQSGARAAASFPFTVRSSGTGAGNAALADDQNHHAEIWLPLWSKSTSLPELRHFLGEGRVTVGRRPARDGFEFRRGLASLGSNRGIDAFQRYGFFERRAPGNGYYVATPLQRIEVKTGLYTELLDDLDKGMWLSKLRRTARDKLTPNAFKSLVRRLEEQLYQLLDYTVSNRGEQDKRALQEILILLGQLHQQIGRSQRLREQLPPRTNLSMKWILQADDRSHEFRLAAAIAGLGAGLEKGMNIKPTKPNRSKKEFAKEFAMARHIHPLSDDLRQWQPESHWLTWSGADLCHDLTKTMGRRLMEANRKNIKIKPVTGIPAANKTAIHQFLITPNLDRRIQALVPGLVLCHMPHFLPSLPTEPQPLPWTFSYLKPLMLEDDTLHAHFGLPKASHLPLPTKIWSLIETGRLSTESGALEIARRRYQASSLSFVNLDNIATELNPKRLAAGLTIPLNKTAIISIGSFLAPLKESAPT